MIKNNLRKFLKYIITKIGNALNLREHERILYHIAHHVSLIEAKQEKIEDYLKTINTVVAGIQTENNPLYNEFDIAEYEINELYRILKNNNTSKVGLINIFSLIKNVSFNKKSVVVLGDEENFMLNRLSKIGATDIKQINFIPKEGKILSKKDVFIYPMNLNKLSLDNYDVMLSYDEYVSSVLLKNKLFDLGNKIKESVIVRVNVISNSAFKNHLDPKIKLDVKNKKIIFNDNFVRYQLHCSGFNEVSCIYTYGNNIDNYFDKKITSFRYLNGYYVKVSNDKFKNNRYYNNSNSVYKIYLATKLPSIKNISKT